MADDQETPPAALTSFSMESAPAAQTWINGQCYRYFAGTGYLGLQSDPAVITAARNALDCHGIHTATSRTGYGNSLPVLEVERRAAEWMGADAALYLATGYAGNFAVTAALSDFVDLALLDEDAHDCLAESAHMLRKLRLPPMRFRHRDANHLSELLDQHYAKGDHVLALTDGVFPVSGRLAPLRDYMHVLRRYPHASLLIDDAHGLAVLGRHGRGSAELAGIDSNGLNQDPARDADEPQVFHTSTLSKAVGGHGGIIIGSREFLGRVRRGSGWFRAASAPAAPVAGATAKALELVRARPELRDRLAANVRQARMGLRSLGLEVDDLPTPIISLRLSSADQMQALQSRLWDERIAIAYARDYAGAGPHGTLRIAIFATHTSQMIDELVTAIGRGIG